MTTTRQPTVNRNLRVLVGRFLGEQPRAGHVYRASSPMMMAGARLCVGSP